MKSFLDFDKRNNIFYDNVWLDDHKIVVKIPLLDEENSKSKAKLENFDLARYTYLFAY